MFSRTTKGFCEVPRKVQLLICTAWRGLLCISVMNQQSVIAARVVMILHKTFSARGTKGLQYDICDKVHTA